MTVNRVYNTSYQQLPARAGGTDYHSKLPSQNNSQFIGLKINVAIILTLSYSSEGSPALAVFRPHYL
jgi:hypothetical protein